MVLATASNAEYRATEKEKKEIFTNQKWAITKGH